MHVAAAEGHLEVCRFLVERCHVQHDRRDRWGFLPIDDAVRFGRTATADYLKQVDEQVH